MILNRSSALAFRRSCTPLATSCKSFASNFKVPTTTPAHHKKTLEGKGYMSLTYPSGQYLTLNAFFVKHGAAISDSCSDYIEQAIETWSVDGHPVIETFINDGYEEVHVTAANEIGETLIMGLAHAHRDYIAVSRDRVDEPYREQTLHSGNPMKSSKTGEQNKHAAQSDPEKEESRKL